MEDIKGKKKGCLSYFELALLFILYELKMGKKVGFKDLKS